MAVGHLVVSVDRDRPCRIFGLFPGAPFATRFLALQALIPVLADLRLVRGTVSTVSAAHLVKPMRDGWSFSVVGQGRLPGSADSDGGAR
jgi:hypothetical protein